MGVFLLLLGLAMVVTAAQAAALACLWREDAGVEPPTVAPAPATGAPQFFAEGPLDTAHRDARIDTLLRHLEQHISLEQAAAESYHLAPTADALHRHVESPLWLH